MASPLDVRTAHTVSFLAEVLRGCTRVLEVGCGRGEVARALGAAGFAITALDLEQRDPRPASNVTYVERDLLDYVGEPFDAIVFTASLHHIAPLERAVSHAAELVVAGGLVVVDDFDLEAPDAATLRWYYDTQELLIAAGLYDHEHLDGTAAHDPVLRWRDAHLHDPPLHSGVQMRTALAARLAIRDVRTCEYLHRYIASGVPQDARGGAIAAHVLATEQRRLADGTLMPVGLRIVAAHA